MYFAAPPPLALDGSPPCRFDMWGLRDAAAAFGVIDSDKVPSTEPPCEELTQTAPGVPGKEMVPGHAREPNRMVKSANMLHGDAGRDSLQSENPELETAWENTELEIAENAKKAGEMWTTLSEEDKRRSHMV